ncbi:MAG: FmdB family zinc ribbon protein [Candidatus Omnitrophota bacterium]|nr:zinc ribbon domain-containing protein [Candidatus Omnitrophota bacterium]
MPTYEYECTECSNKFDAFQKMTDEPLSDCPECQGKVRRLIGAGCGLIFKGSGFYITDYKKSSSCGKPSVDKPRVDKPKEETKSSSCGDSCPMKNKCADTK